MPPYTIAMEWNKKHYSSMLLPSQYSPRKILVMGILYLDSFCFVAKLRNVYSVPTKNSRFVWANKLVSINKSIYFWISAKIL